MRAAIAIASRTVPGTVRGAILSPYLHLLTNGLNDYHPEVLAVALMVYNKETKILEQIWLPRTHNYMEGHRSASRLGSEERASLQVRPACCHEHMMDGAGLARESANDRKSPRRNED